MSDLIWERVRKGDPDNPATWRGPTVDACRACQSERPNHREDCPIAALEAKLEAMERGLAIAMYRESIVDINSHSDEWPRGLISNLGRVDMEAERLMRTEWEKVRPERRVELLSQVGSEIADAAQEQEDE